MRLCAAWHPRQSQDCFEQSGEFAWDRIWTMLGAVVVYLGLGAAFLGVVSLLRPLAFLAIRSRRMALLVVVLGIVVILIGASLPALEQRVADPRTHLDDFVPVS